MIADNLAIKARNSSIEKPSPNDDSHKIIALRTFENWTVNNPALPLKLMS